MADEKKATTIRVFPSTKERYNAELRGHESDDELLNRLLDELQEYRKKAKQDS
jgi:hypothetical protein